MQSHECLYEAERANIGDWAISACRGERWGLLSKLFLVVDLRSAFGRLLGLHLLDRAALNRQIRAALAIGTVPSLSAPGRVPIARTNPKSLDAERTFRILSPSPRRSPRARPEAGQVRTPARDLNSTREGTEEGAMSISRRPLDGPSRSPSSDTGNNNPQPGSRGCT